MSEKKTVKNTVTRKKTTTKANLRYGYRCLGKGIYVSNDTRVTHLNSNDLVIGATGSSKTGSIVYTQLKMLDDSSLIVADSKNMLHRMFRDELEEKGYKVRVLDFVDPKQSCLYNPLDYVRQNEYGSYNETDIMKISRSLIPDKLSADDPFWAISGRAVLEFFISYTLSALPKEDHNMYTVCRLYRAYNEEMGEAAFIDWIERHPRSFAANRFSQIKAMKRADKMWASILGFVNTALYPFDIEILHHIFDPDMKENDWEDDFESFDLCMNDDYYEEEDFITEDEGYLNVEEHPTASPSDGEDQTEVVGETRDTLSLETLGKEKTVVFLNISDTDHSLDSLVNLFYTQALQTLVTEADKNETGQLEVPCRIMFDDFAAGTVIPDFDKMISVIRSRDIWVSINIQSLSQLESLYSPAQSLTIQNNCDHIVYMGSNDLSSAEYIGTRAGKVPEVILAMDRTKEYYIEGGKKAVLVDKVPPYSYTNDYEIKEIL